VEIQWWNADEWYGGGIMHMKLWVVDRKHAYLGCPARYTHNTTAVVTVRLRRSANMDWLSLAQVKELGMVVYNGSSNVAGVAAELFTEWWEFTALDPTEFTARSYDAQYSLHLLTPCWSVYSTQSTLSRYHCALPVGSPRSGRARSARPPFSRRGT
jgi:phospholipase D3/4